MKKKIMPAILSISLLVLPKTAFADDPIQILIDGKTLQTPQSPIIVNNRTLIPLRSIFEALGAQVSWDDSIQTVTATKADKVIVLQIGSNQASVNGKTVAMDVPPQMVSDHTMVPVRFVSESLGDQVDYNGNTNTVTITTGAMIRPSLSQPKSNALFSLGLIRPTANVSETEAPLNRAQAAFVLVKLVGGENEALGTSYSNSFSDVQDSDAPYVGYVTSKGLMTGSTSQEFGSDAPLAVTQCANLLLKGLGYKNEDIRSGNEEAQLNELGVKLEAKDPNRVLESEFYAALYDALRVKKKDDSTYLIKFLADKDVINLTAFTYKMKSLSPQDFAQYLVQNDAKVTIDDKNLESFIRKTLVDKGLIGSEQQDLYLSNVVFLQELLTYSDLHITSLKGLEQFPYLSKISFSYNKLSDITALSTLKHCKELSLYNTGLTDLTPLQGMTGLRKLYISGGTFTDLSPIGHLSNLLILQLSQNNLKSIDGLQGLTSLFNLDISWNSITDLTPLSSLKSLLKLDAGYNKIVDLKPIANLTNLRELSFESNQVASIEPLSGMSHLISLKAKYNALTDLNGIEQLYSLKKAEVDGNQNLSTESIARNISVLTDINNSFSISSLSQYNVSFKDDKVEKAVRSALQKPDGPLTMGDLLGVYELNLNGLGISNVQDLAYLRNLVFLDLRNNKVADFTPLNKLDHLNTLLLAGNGTQDYSSLSSIYTKLSSKDFKIGDESTAAGNSSGLAAKINTFDELVAAAQSSLKYANEPFTVQIHNPSLQNTDLIFYAMQLAENGLSDNYTVKYEKKDMKDIYNTHISPFTKTVIQSSPVSSVYQPNPADSGLWSMTFKVDNNGYSESGRDTFTYHRTLTDTQLHNDNIPSSVASLAKSLTAGKLTDTDKFNAIYDWITRNIAYDIEVFDEIKNQQPESRDQDSESVLKNKMGVCSGYSALLNDMLNAVGIRSVSIPGLPNAGGQVQLGSMSYFDTSSLATKDGAAFFAGSLHEWNAVYLDSKWVYVDSTWDAGTTDLAATSFHQNPQRNYIDSEQVYDRQVYMDGADSFYLADTVIALNPDDVKSIIAKTGITNASYDSYMPYQRSALELHKTSILGFSSGQHMMAVAFDEDSHLTKHYYLLQKDDQGVWNIVKTVDQPTDMLPSDRIKMVINMMIDASNPMNE